MNDINKKGIATSAVARGKKATVSGINPKVFEIYARPARPKRVFEMVTQYAERIMLIMKTRVARAERNISKRTLEIK